MVRGVGREGKDLPSISPQDKKMLKEHELISGTDKAKVFSDQIPDLNSPTFRWFKTKDGEGIGNRKVSKEPVAGDTYLAAAGVLFSNKAFLTKVASRLPKTGTSPIHGPSGA